MGTENNECIVATTWNLDAMQQVKAWVQSLGTKDQTLFAFLPSLVNSKETLFMAPDGSKKGWDTAKHVEELRNQLITLLDSFNYEDGSNPFNWVEVGYGEFGQKVLRGNCQNMYDDEPYAKEGHTT